MSLVNRSRAIEAQSPQPKSRGCAAHGCPMAGSLTESVRPNDSTSWFCRFHFQMKAEDWQGITERVRALSAEERKAWLALPEKRRAA